jgi:inner membrane protein
VNGKTHALLGVASAVALHTYAPYLPAGVPGLPLAVCAAALGALLPDIDADESLIRHSTNTARSDGCLGWIVSHIMPSHRGVTHSGIVALAVIGAAWHWPVYWLIAFAAGYVSHLAADALTRGGIPLAWPVRWRLSLLPLSTGGIGESFVAVLAVAFLVVYVLRQFGMLAAVEHYVRLVTG